LWRIVVGVALALAAPAIDVVAVSAGFVPWVRTFAVFSCLAGIAIFVTVILRSRGVSRLVAFATVDGVAGLAAVLDALVLIVGRR
jgi:hypothetical protein